MLLFKWLGRSQQGFKVIKVYLRGLLVLEKDIENLLANYPDDFFPNAGFILHGQQVRLGNCRADILFKDKYDRTIIIEVKKGILSRDTSGQILEYYGLLKQDNFNTIIELILCANVIPAERRMFLENNGIECKELGVGLITAIAQKYNYRFLDEVKKEQIAKVDSKQPAFYEPISVNKKKGQRVWIFQANPNRFDILNALSDTSYNKDTWLVNQYQNEIKAGDTALIWMSGTKDGGIYAVGEVLTNPMVIHDNPETDKYWLSEDDRGKEKLRVNIKFNNKLLNHPVFRSELKKLDGLKNLSIFKIPRGTNFPVEESEWQIIKEQIENNM